MTATALRPPVPRPQLLLPPVPPAFPVAPEELPALRLRSARSPLIEAWPVSVRPAPQPPPPPDPRQLCGAVVLAAVEALRTTRPLVQLARWVSPAVYEALARAAVPAPVRQRAVLRAVRTCRVSAAATEATVVVQDGDRVRAAAVRLELHRGSWRATALQIG